MKNMQDISTLVYVNNCANCVSFSKFENNFAKQCCTNYVFFQWDIF